MTSDDKEIDHLSQVETFADEVVSPAAAGWAMGESPAPDIFTKAAELGLMGLELPAQKGGLGFGFAHKLKVFQALGAVDFGFAMSVVNTHNVALRLSQSGVGPLCEWSLPLLLSGQVSACTAITEPGVGSDVSAMRTRARKTDEGWLLSGEKTWIVNGRRATFAIVYAQCEVQNSAAGIGGFLVDLTSPGIRRYPIDCGFSQTSIGTGRFVLESVNVSDENLLLVPGSAFKTILIEINSARAYVAAMCCGMLRTAMQQVSHYGARRHSFGVSLYGHQAWRFCLAQADADLAAAEALVMRCAEDLDNLQLRAAEAKVNAVSVCQRHLPALLHAMGAEGLRPEYCFTRHLAAVQLAALTDGSTEMLLERISQLTQDPNTK